jgi:hypothetical protein
VWSCFGPHFRLTLEEGPCYPPGFARANPGQFKNARLISSTILVQADNPRRPVNIYDGSDVGSCAWPSPTVLGGIPGRIPRDRISAPLHGLMVNRYREGRAVIPAPGRQEFHLDVAVATHKKIDLVFQTQVFKLKRDMQKRSRDSASSFALRQNLVAEGIDETPANSSTTVCGGPSRARTSAAGDQDHSRTSGGTKCK